MRFLASFLVMGIVGAMGLCGSAQAKAIVIKRALNVAAQGKQILTNGDLERLEAGKIAEVQPWEKGYEVDTRVARSGKVSARVTITDPAAGQHGLTYPVVLNQKIAMPFTAELWSKAENVSGTADSHYSLYIDLEYMDGTPLWGQIAPFSVGTHDWEKRTVTVVPEKPVRNVSFHAIFRHHTGTVWFDDFAFYILDLPGGASLFDGIPVLGGGATGEPQRAPRSLFWGRPAETLFVLTEEGEWSGPQLKGRGGLMVREARRKSDFRRPLGTVQRAGDKLRFEGVDEELGLKVTAEYALMGTPPHTAIRVDGIIEDLTGEERGVSIYAVLPLTADRWHDDMRTSRPIEAGQSYAFTTQVGCGANGRMSLYPFGCITAGNNTFVAGAPLDPPRLYRFGYDAASGELYAVEDLGLTKDGKTPQKASFSFVIYQPPAFGFRGALDAYYKLFPEFFVKRTKVEGNWVAFDDIARVENHEDFYIAFKEGTNNPDFDEQHGILTYTYVEPASYWMAMPKDMPRTPEEALKYLAQQAAQKPPVPRAAATMTSALKKADGSLHFSLENAPWCDGALFILNPDPDIPTTAEYPINQGMLLWQSIRRELDGGPQEGLSYWRPWGEGFSVAPGEGRNGSQAAVIERTAAGPGHGLSQSIALHQEKPGRIIVSAWSKAENVTGEADKDYSLYCDLVLADGSSSWGHAAAFTPGTHDWEQKQVVIDLPQPVRTIALYLLFRGHHTGKIWLDDVSVTLEGSAENLVRNPGLEPLPASKARIDGTYIDSLEMAATALDFDRNHWRAADVPLVFTTAEGLPAELLMFGTYEFVKDVSEKMHAEERTIFANSALHRFAQPAAILDVMGTETNWHRGGRWTPMPDAECNFKRALCYQRPYLLLQNTVFEEFPVELVEKYMSRAIFYGMMPSFFSHNAAERTYWSRPEIYNRDRHLFKKYMPAAKLIAAAGWEPLTYAATDNPKVYVERWGRGAEIYFTLFNDSQQPQTYVLSIDTRALGLKAFKGVEVLIGDKSVEGKPVIRETIGPEELRVFKIIP